MLTFGAGGQFQDGGAAGIVGQHDRHAAGTEVQRDEEPLVELAFEAEDVWRRADQALRPGLQRGFARAQVDQPADERERRPGIVLLRFHAEESGVGDDRQPGLRGGEAGARAGLSRRPPRHRRPLRVPAVDVHDPVGRYLGIRQTEFLPVIQERRAAQRADQHGCHPRAALPAPRLGGVAGGDP